MGLRDWLSGMLAGSDDSDEESNRYGTFRIESISPNLVVIPESQDVEAVDVRYPLIEPFADAHVYWDSGEETLVYEVEEPTLDAREEQILDDLKDALEEKLDVPLTKLESTADVIDYLEEKMDEVLTELGYRLNDESRNKVMYYVYRNFAGLNDIEPLMHDPYIEDIGCSGIGIPVYVVHSKFGSIRTALEFDDGDVLKNLVVKLAERANKYVSYAEPLLDGTLPDGSRVNASLTKDVTTKGPTFSIRKFQEVPYSAIDLLDLGTADLDILTYMWLAMEYQKSLLVIGGTATGKTTFLNAIVTFIPPEQKIVSIEDTRELQLPHENWIPSVTRSGVGLESDQVDISMYQLLRESFRQNPDYVIVGEVRGEEASVLFQGMASGHPSISTMHASSPYDVISRLITPPINLSPSLVETLDFIVAMTHAQGLGKNSRRVRAIYEIEDISREGTPRTNEFLSWVPVDDTFSKKDDSTVMDTIQRQYGIGKKELEQEWEDRRKVLEWMHDNNYTHFSEVARIVSEYYKGKERIMQAISDDTAVGMQDILEGGDVSEGDVAGEEELFGGSVSVADNPFKHRSRPAPPPEKASGSEAVSEENAIIIDDDRPDPGTVEDDDSDTSPVVVEDDSSTEYDALVQQETVPAIKQRVTEEQLDPEQVLAAERRNKNRVTLVQWLEKLVAAQEAAEDVQPEDSTDSALPDELFGVGEDEDIDEEELFADTDQVEKDPFEA